MLDKKDSAFDFDIWEQKTFIYTTSSCLLMSFLLTAE